MLIRRQADGGHVAFVTAMPGLNVGWMFWEDGECRGIVAESAGEGCGEADR